MGPLDSPPVHLTWTRRLAFLGGLLAVVGSGAALFLGVAHGRELWALLAGRVPEQDAGAPQAGYSALVDLLAWALVATVGAFLWVLASGSRSGEE